MNRELTERRRRGITATDARAIMGCDPWRSAADVWLDKKQPEQVDENTKNRPWLEWGNLLEPLIASKYAEKTNQKLRDSELLQNTKVPWMMGTPDRLVVGKDKGLEIKTSNQRDFYGWGPTGSNLIPPAYMIQIQYYMMLTGFKEWDCAALIGGSDFRIYHLFPDRAMQREIFNYAHTFYTRFILGNETPDFDWGESIKKFIARKFPQADKSKPVVELGNQSDPELCKAILDLRTARANQKVAEQDEATHKALVQSFMKDHGKLVWKDEGITINWNNVKSSVKIDYKELSEKLLPLITDTEQKEALLKSVSSETGGSRRFVMYDRKDKTGGGSDSYGD